MGLFNFMKRAEEAPDTNTEQGLLSALTGDDELMDFNKAMKVPAFSACVNLISNIISMIPIKLYKHTEEGVEEIKDDIRVYLLNTDTKDTLTAVEMKKSLVEDYFGKGGYVYINSRGNKIESLNYIDNSYISVMSNTDPIFKNYNIAVNGKEYTMFKFLKMLRHSKNGWSSISIVSENEEILKTAYLSILLEQNLNKTGGEPNGFITSERNLTDDSIKNLKEAWKNKYSNVRDKENVLILNNGLKFQPSSATSVEMQLNENKKQNGTEICSMFNVPERMIYGSPTEQDKIDLIEFCINPILCEFEASLNRDLLLESEKQSLFFKADTSELLKADIEKRFNAYEKGLKNGFLQIDEIRERENYEPLGLNFIKLGLSDVLYNPDTKEIYTPNTGVGANLENITTEEEDLENITTEGDSNE